MTAASVTIVCANCGAKYKLPADFKSASAKCKGCGATIDVASQLKAAAAPPAAQRPVAKAPTPQPSKASPSTRDGARRERSSASGSASASRRSSGSSSRRGRDGAAGETAEKKGGKGLLIGSVVGIVALGVVGYFVFVGGGKDPAGVVAAASSDPGANIKDAALTKPNAMQDAAKAEADALAKELRDGAKPVTAGDKPEDKKPATKKPAKAPVTKPTEEKKPLTADEVFDPRTLPPLEFPAYVEPPLRDEINSLCEDLRNGGISGRRAKTRLEEIGHPALAGVINAYGKIDFRSPDQAMYAFEMNKLLTNAFGAGVVSTDFKPTQAGEEIPLETADWNAKTVNAWRRFWERHSDKAVWESMVAARKEGKGAPGASKDKAKDDDK